MTASPDGTLTDRGNSIIICTGKVVHAGLKLQKQKNTGEDTILWESIIWDLMRERRA